MKSLVIGVALLCLASSCMAAGKVFWSIQDGQAVKIYVENNVVKNRKLLPLSEFRKFATPYLSAKGEKRDPIAIVSAKLLEKELRKIKYQKKFIMAFEFTGNGLKTKTRAIKGLVEFCDLFGDVIHRVNFTINDPLSPGEKIVKNDMVLDFNQFMQTHNWLATTEIKDMLFRFRVSKIIYANGTSESFN